MREGWTSAALKNVCTVDKGKHSGECLPYVGLEHIESGTGRFVGSLEPTAVKSTTFRFTPRHVLYGRLRPYLNKVLLPNFDGHCSSEIFPLRVNSNLNRQFLYYWLTWEPVVKKIDKTSTGARMPRANVNKLLDFELPLPPLPEQKRIVAILDEAFAGIATAIANTEKNLANARELFDGTAQAIFLSAQDWEEHTLSELLETGWITSHLDGNHGSEYPRKSDFVIQGVPYISANCLKNDAVDFHEAKFLTRERAASIRKGIARDGDVLFAHNATVGPVALLRTEFEEVILSTSLTYYRCNSDYIVSGYLAHYMRSPLFRRQYEAVMRQSTRNQVPITMQRRFVHLIPPIERQREITEQLDSLRLATQRLEQTSQQKLNALAELKQSLLQKAFSGELTAGKKASEAIRKAEEVA